MELLREIDVNLGEIVTVCGAMQLEYYLIIKTTFEEETNNNVLRQCLIGLRNICQIDNIKTVFFSKDTIFLHNLDILKEMIGKIGIDLYLRIN